MARGPFLACTAHFAHHLLHERLVGELSWLHGVDITRSREAVVAVGAIFEDSGIFRRQNLGVSLTVEVARGHDVRDSQGRQEARAPLRVGRYECGGALLAASPLATVLVPIEFGLEQAHLQRMLLLLLLVHFNRVLSRLGAARLDRLVQVLIEGLTELAQSHILNDPLRFDIYCLRVIRWLHSELVLLDLQGAQEVCLLWRHGLKAMGEVASGHRSRLDSAHVAMKMLNLLMVNAYVRVLWTCNRHRRRYCSLIQLLTHKVMSRAALANDCIHLLPGHGSHKAQLTSFTEVLAHLGQVVRVGRTSVRACERHDAVLDRNLVLLAKSLCSCLGLSCYLKSFLSCARAALISLLLVHVVERQILRETALLLAIMIVFS